MAKSYNHSDCFAYFGTVPKNPRWSWSGRSRDDSIVSVTLWQDRFESGGRIYRSHNHQGDEPWLHSPGHSELLENLALARDKLDGTVHVIVAIPKDRNAAPRSIRECFPHPSLKMRVTELDMASGEFTLERIDP